MRVCHSYLSGAAFWPARPAAAGRNDSSARYFAYSREVFEEDFLDPCHHLLIKGVFCLQRSFLCSFPRSFLRSLLRSPFCRSLRVSFVYDVSDFLLCEARPARNIGEL